jgi:hypothetical protein
MKYFNGDDVNKYGIKYKENDAYYSNYIGSKLLYLKKRDYKECGCQRGGFDACVHCIDKFGETTSPEENISKDRKKYLLLLKF